MKKRKLAIFDIDGTLFRSSLLIELVHKLIDADIFPQEARSEMYSHYNKWSNRQGTYEAYIMSVVGVYSTHIIGKKEIEVLQVADAVLDEHKDKLYCFTRDLIPYLKSKEFTLMAISGSPLIIVSKFASIIGFDHFRGTSHITENGVITGSPSAYTRKKQIIEEFLKLHSFDLADAIAVGDTEGDISLLELVGCPIAFNPNTLLAKHAKEHKWPVIVERKDMIYRLDRWAEVKQPEDVLPDLMPNF